MNRYAYRRPLFRAVAAAVDGVLGLVFRQGGPAPESASKAVLFRLDQIGDAFYCTPLLDYLAARYPGIRVDVVTTERCAPVFAGHPALGKIHIFNYGRFARGGKRDSWLSTLGLARKLRSARYDIAVDPRGEPLVALLSLLSGARVRVGLAGEEVLSSTYTHPVRYDPAAPAWHRFRAILRVFGIEAATWEPHVELSAEERASAATRAAEYGKFLVLHLGAGVPFKRWPVERFAEIARAAQVRGLRVVTVGAGEDRALGAELAALGVEVTDLAGQLSVRDTYALLEHAAGFVGNDSAPVHLAAATGIPTVHLMSASSPASASALGPRVSVVFGRDPEHACGVDRCPYPCPHVARIAAAEVVAALRGVLG